MRHSGNRHAGESGFLLIDKPRGLTSHDVVDAVRRARGNNRVGHGGTLDPLATGLLIVGIGAATKGLQAVLGLPKTYVAEVTLGATSVTDDAEGPLATVSVATPPSADAVAFSLQTFRGTVMQHPPAYSAVKTDGVPAYTRARRGEVVSLPPRRVTIFDLVLLAYAFPVLRLRATVSSGTYIRALVRDLGTQLGTGAYLSSLRRTHIGAFRVTEAIPLSAVGRATPLKILTGMEEK